ncbi:MAG: hypothetical protein RR685_05620, partial [Hungatella sp.]
EKTAMAVGCGLGQETSAPTATQIIVVKDVAIAFDVTFDAFKKGELKATEVEKYGANKGVVYLTDWFATVDDAVKAKVTETMDKMASGEIVITID